MRAAIAIGIAALAIWWLIKSSAPQEQGATAFAPALSQVEVIDGDTVRVGGAKFRLVGFDAPETWQAQCSSELELGNRATARLRQLIAGGGVDLERIACSCRPGTEGTMKCNYGRSCGILRVHGQDVGQVLMH